ncbi:MAG: T9SS type A sorting domain-containing protein [Bacteroidales bacterium]|nr:T9SS type A sorting domain-containing protein [Bacteroidales bacterium]
MKKITLLSVLLSFLLLTGGLQAQLSSGAREQAKRFKVEKPILNQKGENGIGQLPVNPTVVTKAVLDDPVLMITRYDLQSNASSENRIHLFTDGTVGAVTMMSHTDAFTDRGTGTNFYDGTAWGPQPSARIESSKSGWPSYAPWGPNGEIVVTHHMLDGLFIMRRATKGTGDWTEAILPGPAGAVDISWPRVVTNGPDNMYVHVIATTYTSYQGLEPYALLYYRSMDGGVTWDIQHEVIPGMTSADYLGFTADMYGWAQPRGDTLAFAFCDPWMDLAIMKSYNNGLDWEKIVAWPSQWNTTPTTGTVDDFYAPDGTVALALDKYGKAHVATGMMISAANDAGVKQWAPQTDGVLYWNEDMPQLPEVLDRDELLASGNLIGWVTDTNVYNVDPTHIAWYYNSMTSQPTITVDDDDFVFVMWSGVTMNPDPDDYLLRHIYARGSSDYGASWTTSLIDLTSDFIQYNWSECVYPSVSWNTDDYLYLVFQEDDYAGVSLNGAQGAQGQVAIGDNNIRFMKPSKMDILFPVGTEKEQKQSFHVSQNFPNPAAGYTTVSVNLTQPGTLGLEVTNLMGQQVEVISKGNCTAGNYYFTVNTKGLTPGIYFYTVTFNNGKVTKKMIVE